MRLRPWMVSVVFAVTLLLPAAEVVPTGGIVVSPNVVNLSSASSTITVHTDLPYGQVAGASVTLNGIEIAWWKADSQGYFVAKFDADEIKAVLPTGETVEVVLEGSTVGGDCFRFSDTITVIDAKGVKR